MSDLNYFQTAATELSQVDQRLGKVIEQVGILTPSTQAVESYFQALVQKITYQQLSTKAAGTILRRVEELIGGRYEPRHMLQFEAEAYRAAGLSRQKFGYISDLCRHFVEEPEFYTQLDQYEDAEVVKKLTQVKGIGVWTAQMFLMSPLGRKDVFAPDDVGLQNAVVRLYGFEKKPGKKELVKFAEQWAPHRTAASRYLWASLEL